MAISLVRSSVPFLIRKGVYSLKPYSILSAHETSRDLISEVLQKTNDINLAPFLIGPGGCSLRQSSTGGHIDLQLYLLDKNGNSVDPSNVPDDLTNEYSTYTLRFKNLFDDGFRLLQNFVDTGNDQETIFQPLAALRSFLLEKEDHETSLLRTIERDVKLRETEECTVLAVHLLSKLVYPDNKSYIVSNDYSYKPRFCPCNLCETEITYGSTGFGSRELWYGRPDVIVFPKGGGMFSIVIPVKDELKEIGNEEDWSEKNAVESLTTRLEDEENIRKICRDTITFSFYQRMYQKRFVLEEQITTLIPFVAICKDCFDIYMYDTEHDVFLKNHSKPIPLWLNESGLNLSAVLYLWMIVNHLFLKPKLTNNYLQKVAGTFGLQKFIPMQQYPLIENTIQMKRDFEDNKLLTKSLNFPGIPLD